MLLDTQGLPEVSEVWPDDGRYPKYKGFKESHSEELCDSEYDPEDLWEVGSD